jgi:phosphoserine phosphatase
LPRRSSAQIALREIGYRILAIGDGFNDEQMFRVAHHPVLFNAPDELARRVPEGVRVTNYDELRRVILDAHTRLIEGEFDDERESAQTRSTG